MARKTLVVPSFTSEAEEAAWWHRHRRAVEAELRRRIKGGTVHTLAEVMERAENKKPLKPVTIRMRLDDIATARELAARKGIGYQTYIKLLLRQALQRESGLL